MDSLTSSFTPPCGHLLPKEGGIDTLKTPHILAPSSGRGCLAQRDGVGSPRMLEMHFPVSLSPPLSGIALYKKSTRSGARVLSLAVICAKTFFHPYHPPFIPPVPYPPLRGTFPARGRLTIRGKPAINRPSGIAPFRHPERRETSYVR